MQTGAFLDYVSLGLHIVLFSGILIGNPVF